MRSNSDQAAELTSLGEAVVDGDVNAAKAAARVRAIAEDAARRAGVVRPDVNRYSGLSLRLGLLGEETPYAAAPADDLSADETADPVARTARVGSRPVKRPWTWWIFGRAPWMPACKDSSASAWAGAAPWWITAPCRART